MGEGDGGVRSPWLLTKKRAAWLIGPSPGIDERCVSGRPSPPGSSPGQAPTLVCSMGLGPAKVIADRRGRSLASGAWREPRDQRRRPSPCCRFRLLTRCRRRGLSPEPRRCHRIRRSLRRTREPRCRPMSRRSPIRPRTPPGHRQGRTEPWAHRSAHAATDARTPTGPPATGPISSRDTAPATPCPDAPGRRDAPRRLPLPGPDRPILLG